MQIEEFMQIPTKEQWASELAQGWEGPDGSSCSTDHIMGIRIGITSPCYGYIDLPANLHDWRYQLGRRFDLSEAHRRAADIAYRKDCIREIKESLDGKMMTAIGIFRSWVRYYALRAFGWKAWRFR